jgi:hypothetical protein
VWRKCKQASPRTVKASMAEGQTVVTGNIRRRILLMRRKKIRQGGCDGRESNSFNMRWLTGHAFKLSLHVNDMLPLYLLAHARWSPVGQSSCRACGCRLMGGLPACVRPRTRQTSIHHLTPADCWSIILGVHQIQKFTTLRRSCYELSHHC